MIGCFCGSYQRFGVHAYGCPAIEPTACECGECEYCDGTGDVHRADGEWLGSCDCTALDDRREADGDEA